MGDYNGDYGQQEDYGHGYDESDYGGGYNSPSEESPAPEPEQKTD